MSGVVQIGRKPHRAIVIRRAANSRFTFVVAAMVLPAAGAKASYIDLQRVFGTDDFAEAWTTARAEAARTGLPVVDVASPPRRGPQGPGSPGGLRTAA